MIIMIDYRKHISEKSLILQRRGLSGSKSIFQPIEHSIINILPTSHVP